ncbi:hypothetical protein N7465_007024 [Penicillium sp. CMV-2018d]|nr:hypothetical protein N7465_007024 [Penicillium sp. CMV-2018d]
MDLETQQASAKAGGWSVGVVRLGGIEPPFHTLSARGPYLKMQECAAVQSTEFQASWNRRHGDRQQKLVRPVIAELYLTI